MIFFAVVTATETNEGHARPHDAETRARVAECLAAAGTRYRGGQPGAELYNHEADALEAAAKRAKASGKSMAIVRVDVAVRVDHVNTVHVETRTALKAGSGEVVIVVGG